MIKNMATFPSKSQTSLFARSQLRPASISAAYFLTQQGNQKIIFQILFMTVCSKGHNTVFTSIYSLWLWLFMAQIIKLN